MRKNREEKYMKKNAQDDTTGAGAGEMEEKDLQEQEAGPCGDEHEIEELPQEQILRLQEELEKKAKESENNYERFLRACADLENYKKRSEKEKEDIRNYAAQGVILDVLPVLDNLERAFLHAAEGQNNLEALKEGVRLTIDQLHSALGKAGLTEIKAMGEKFDPSVHHAISHEDSDEVDPGTVVKEFQKGYMLKGRLLRPSMVAVSKRP